MGENKNKYNKYLLLLISSIIIIGMIASSLQSSEIDLICNTDNKIIKRINGNWTCSDDQTSINTTNNITNNYYTNITNNITSNDGTGGWTNTTTKTTANLQVQSYNGGYGTYDGAFIATGGNPSSVQILSRASGGFAYSLFNGFANSTTTNLTSKLIDIGILGNLQSGSIAPTVTYGYIGVGATSAYDNTHIRFYNKTTKDVTIDGYLGIGTTTPSNKLTVSGGNFEILGTSQSYPGLITSSYSNTSWHGTFINIYRGRGNTPTGQRIAVSDGDTVLSEEGWVWNGSTSVRIGQFMLTTGTAVTNGYVGGKWSWRTTNSSGTLNEVFTVDANANAWFMKDVSALTYTDRTPWSEANALDTLRPITGNNNKIDYSSLPNSLKKTGQKPVYKIVQVDNDTTELVLDKYVTEYGRDLSLTVSVLIKAVQELEAQNIELKMALCKQHPEEIICK